MQWEREAWRQLYLREEGSFASLPLYVRGLAAEIIKFCDDDGRISLGGAEPWQAIAKVARAEPNERRVVKKHVQILLDDGYLVVDGTHVRVRNLRAAQVGTLSSHGPATQVASERPEAMHPLCIHSASTLHPVDAHSATCDAAYESDDVQRDGTGDALTRASDPDLYSDPYEERRDPEEIRKLREPSPATLAADQAAVADGVPPICASDVAPTTARSEAVAAVVRNGPQEAGSDSTLADASTPVRKRRRGAAAPKQSASAKPPKSSDAPKATARYREAYEAGVRRGGNGAAFTAVGSSWTELGRAAAVHAVGPHGPLGGDALVAWIGSSAEEFRRSTAEKGHVWGGWSVRSFVRWLNSGRPREGRYNAAPRIDDSPEKYGETRRDFDLRMADDNARYMARLERERTERRARLSPAELLADEECPL